jgi:hypothetical protein
MTRIYLETGSKKTSEYVFIRTLLEDVLNFDKSKYAVEIECVGGKDNLTNVTNKMIDTTLSEGGTNLIIFDADSQAKAKDGGCIKRKKALRQILDSKGVQAEIFLFPNDKDDGDVETLLERLMRKDLHEKFFDCYNDYETCLGDDYVRPDLKTRLFAYIRAQKGLSNKQRKHIGEGKWLFTDDKYWDMNSKDLEPLKTFLMNWVK